MNKQKPSNNVFPELLQSKILRLKRTNLSHLSVTHQHLLPSVIPAVKPSNMPNQSCGENCPVQKITHEVNENLVPVKCLQWRGGKRNPCIKLYSTHARRTCPNSYLSVTSDMVSYVRPSRRARHPNGMTAFT